MNKLRQWFKNKFKSRAQRDRESGYYNKLPRVGSAHKDPADQIAEILAEANRTDRQRVKLVPQPQLTLLERFKTFYRNYGVPNPKQILALLFPSEWMFEKLWRKWDPTDKNNREAPPAGYYDADTGNVYDHNHKFIRCTKTPLKW